MPSIMALAPVLSPKSHEEQDHALQVSNQSSALQAISAGGVILQGPPTFNSFEKQRRWMLEHMAGAFRVFARKGFTEGIAGHISLRDPEHADCFWTNPYVSILSSKSCTKIATDHASYLTG